MAMRLEPAGGLTEVLNEVVVFQHYAVFQPRLTTIQIAAR